MMAKILGTIFFLLLLATGATHAVACFHGLNGYIESGILSFLLLLVIVEVPLLSTYFAVQGAMEVWGWSLTKACLVLGWVYLIPIVIGVAALAQAFKRR